MTSDDLHILDAICACAERRAFIAKPRNRRLQKALTRLRHRGLIAFESWRPSQSALVSWRERHSEFHETPSRLVTGREGPVGGSPPYGAPPATAATEEEVLETPASFPEPVEAAGKCPAAAADLPSKAIEQEQAAFQARRPQDPNWAEAEDARLREAYAAGERIDLVAEELGRTFRAASSRAQKLGLSGSHAAGRGGFATEPDWTPAEEARLRELYGTMRAADLAVKMGRSKGGIYQRAWALGLKANYHQGWSADEQLALDIAFRRGLSLADLAVALGRNYQAAAKYAANHGLKFGRRARLVEPLSLADILALADENRPLPPTSRSTQSGPRPVRRESRWDEARKDVFLAALRDKGTVGQALVAIGLKAVSTKSYLQAKRDDAGFGELCTAAILEHATRRRANPARSHSAVAEIAPATSPSTTIKRAPPGRLVAGSGTHRAFHVGGEGTPQPVQRRKSDAEVVADSLRHQEEQARFRALRPPMGQEEAKLALQRRGFSVCRASTIGGEPGLWAVGTLTLTEREMIAKAARIEQ